jgi:hypothetical protein
MSTPGGSVRAVAQVHVHVGGRPKPARPGRRFVRWCDRTLLGAGMGVVAFVLERLVVRSAKKTAGAPVAADDSG